ncbi:MAG: hypothetical protein V1718_06625 [archaeon]
MVRYWVIFFVILILFQSAFASAQLQIDKIADPRSVESGGTVRVLLNISNPFEQELTVKIRDMNSIGGTTLDTQCIQGRIPANAIGVSEYETIQVQNPGTYTLGTIEVKYTNPETGKEEIVSGKNEVVVTVTGGNPNYAFSSTSTKSECQFDDQPQQQEQQQQQEEEQKQESKTEEQKSVQEKMEEMKQQQDPTQNKISQSRQQTGHDMSSVKNQQQKEADEAQQKVDRELDDALSQNKDFQDMKKDLESKGYQEKSKSRSDLRDNETEFKYEYEKPTGEKGEITGKMKDGRIEDIKKLSDDDKRELDDKLSLNKDFQEEENRLRDEGFVPDKKEFSGLNPRNETTFNYQYKRDDGESANITGDIKSGDVSQVGMKSTALEKKVMEALSNSSDFKKLDDKLRSEGFLPKDLDLKPFMKNESSFSLAYSNGNETMNITGSVQLDGDEVKIDDIELEDGRTLFDKLKIPILLILVLLGVYSYMRYLKRDVAVTRVAVPLVDVKPLDARKEAMKLITKAQKMYDSGKKKEAYTLVSQGVRLYFKYVIASDKEELTTSEILRYVRGKEEEKYVVDLKECFTLCDLVKFAKYKPNDEDFGRVIELAKKCVK